MSSIVKLFANPTLTDVLSLLLQNSDEEFYQTEIVNKTGKILIQVQRALKTLEEVGIITKSRRGKSVFYKISKEHPAYDDLKRMFLKTVALGDAFQSALQPLQNKIQFAFIFGSIAKGNESFDSDIDLFLLGDASLREVSKALSLLSKESKRPINPVLFSLSEFKKRVSQNDHFLLEIVRTAKIWIVGNDVEFNKMVKGR